MIKSSNDIKLTNPEARSKIPKMVVLLFLLFFYLKCLKIINSWHWYVIFSFLIFGGALIIAHFEDKSIPFLSSLLQVQYFRTKYKISLWENLSGANIDDTNIAPRLSDCLPAQTDHNTSLCCPRAGLTDFMRRQFKWVNIRTLLNRIYLKFLYYLILIAKNSDESFEILREDLQEKHGNEIKIKVKNCKVEEASKEGIIEARHCFVQEQQPEEIKNQQIVPSTDSEQSLRLAERTGIIIDIKNQDEEWINLEKLTEMVKRGEVKDNDVLEKLVIKLYEFHKRNRKKATFFSLAGLSVIVIATVVSGLLTSFIFPTIFKSNAATYTWTQTDWHVGADAATTGHPAPADWNKFAASTNIDYGTSGEIKLATSTGSFAETFTGTDYKDTASTTANWNTATGQVESPAELEATELREKLNGIIGYSIKSLVINGDDVYIGAVHGRFAKFNKTTGVLTDLTSKIYSFWGTYDINALLLDSSHKVIYLGGPSNFARYNLASYSSGGTYPDADTAYNLYSKLATLYPSSGSTNYTLALDSSHDVLYLGFAAGRLARYNTTFYSGGGTYPTADTIYALDAKISSFWSTSTIYALSFDAIHDVLYVGGDSGKLARYNTTSYAGGGTYPTADTAYDLTDKISSVVGSNSIRSLAFDTVNYVLYFVCHAGKFMLYNTDAYTGEGTYPLADTAYDLTSKISSFWGTTNVYALSFDSSKKALYLGGGGSRFARYNTYFFPGGGTYSAADTAYNLFSKISSYMGSSYNVNAMTFDSSLDAVFLGGLAIKFVRYNTDTYSSGGSYPLADTSYDFTSTMGTFWEGNTINAMVYGESNTIYIGGLYGKFAKYNTQTETFTDLSSKLTSISTSFATYSLVFDSLNNVLYIGGQDGKLVRYNTAAYTGGGTYPTADTAYNLTSKISSFFTTTIMTVGFDSENNALYLGGLSGALARYNTTSYSAGGTYPTADTAYNLSGKLSSFWESSSIFSLVLDFSNEVLYVGGGNGKFCRYNTSFYAGGATYPSADTAYDLTSKVSGFWGGYYVYAMTFDSAHNVVYLGAGAKFSRYNTDVYNGGGTYPTADSAYDLTSKISSISFITITEFFLDDTAEVIYIGGDYGKFGRYDIESDTAVNLRGDSNIISFWGISSADDFTSFCMNNTTRELYFAGESANIAVKPALPYPAIAQSLAIDTMDANIYYATLAKNDTPGGGSATYYLSNNGGTDWVAATPGQEVAFATAGSDLRFKAGVTVGATIQDLSVEYWSYDTAGNLISSIYNSTDAANIMAKLEWSENLATSTDVKFQLRTAATSGGLDAAEWLGPTNAIDYYTATSGTEIIHASQRDGSGDQYFQYKVFLTSDGLYTPTLSDVTLTYVVNAAPQLQNISASQGNDGLVTISYDVRDSDTSTGSPANQGYVTPSFQYLDAGGIWTPCAHMAAGDTDNKAVNLDGTTWNTYSAYWDANEDYANHFMDNTARIKVIVNDNEAANNIASSTSSTFILDTKVPASASVKINATTTPAVLTLAATDDSSLNMKIGLSLHGGASEAYSTTDTISLETDPDTIYVDFIDQYGNTTSVNATTPSKPLNMIIRDISNLPTTDYQLFVAWKAVSAPTPGFKRYNIYRSTNGINFPLYDSTITDRTINYYADFTLDSATTYYYKVATEDTNDNVSYISNTVSDTPDGQGGTDTTPPTITNVQTSATTTQSITITWDTDELANSTVEYITVTGGDFSAAQSQGVATMRDDAAGLGAHEVILTGLVPATTYYFQVKSQDPQENIGTEKLGEDGYTFTTNAGATISNVSASEINNTSAVVTWNTDIEGNSSVFYATNANLTGASQIGNSATSTAHSVSLANLTQGTKYYYYVKSQDEEENIAEDKNGGDYYTFTTTEDSFGPVITSVAANLVTDTKAVITWTTDEPSTSRVNYGTTSGTHSTLSGLIADLNEAHTVTLENLTAETKYYYKVISKDASNNTSTSTAEYDFTTLETLSTETEVEERETTARDLGETAGRASVSGGGGILIIDKTDKVAPVISAISAKNIKADAVDIAWSTNEPANGFVEYGESTGYSKTLGHYNTMVSHLMNLDNLKSGKIYHYRIASIDSSGNLVQSQDQTFTTLAKTVEEKIIEEQEKSEEIKEEAEKANEKLFKDIQALANPNKGFSKEEIFVSAATAAQKAMEVLKNISREVSIETAEKNISTQFENWKELGNIIPPPILSGEPRVITTATTAIITWKTDKESNSLVAIAPNSAFQSAKDKDNPYIQIVGNPNEKIKEHVVTIYELRSETVYHYQIRSQGNLGPMAKSSDFNFKTKSEILEISNYAVQNVSNEKVIFKWVTNLETDAQIKYIPYRDNKLMVEEEKNVNDKAMSIIHEIEIDNLEAGIIYQVELSGKDIKGNIALKLIPTYSTSKDDLPPIIFQVQTESAISPGKEEKIQTIISWLTNEQSASRVYYMKGIGRKEDEFSEKTMQDNNFTKKHVVVITKFDPGSVYSFKVESMDSGGNVGFSKIYTILTPRQKESVFQVIMKNLEQTFGWVSKIKN